MIRCAWAETSPLMMTYHDTEWGVPLHDDRRLFEALILDGAQAGLSWETILKKRENYRRAFHDFGAERIARYTEKDIRRLLTDPGIVRNRLKVSSAVKNARAFLETQEEFGSFDRYLWQFVGGRTITNRFKTHKDIPAQTQASEAMSKNLKKRGFSFVGPTICYAMMQAVGMVNDHTTSCFRHRQVQKEN
jgi:DNA-3-methyladenine glycosylase I